MLRRLLAAWPFAARGTAMILGAFALAWGVTGSAGLLAAMLGALTGSMVGQLVATRTKLRLPVLVVGWALVALLAWGLTSLAASTSFVARTIGPTRTILFIGVVRFGALAVATTATLRAIAARKPTAVALELAVLATAFTAAFAAHRDGNLSRPLWLSDWAWRQGIDPSIVLLSVGFASVGLLAAILLVETKSRRAVSSMLFLGVVAVIILLYVRAVGLPKPQALTEVPTSSTGGQHPPPPPSTDGGSPSGQDPNALDGGGEPEGGGTPEAGGDAASDAGGTSDAASEGGSSDAASDSGGSSDAASDSGGSESDAPSEGGGSPPPKQPHLTEDPSQSPTSAPVAVVLFDDDYSSPSQSYYFREDALSQYNDTRLVATSRGDADRDIAVGFPAVSTPVDELPPDAEELASHAGTDAGVDAGSIPERALVRTTVALLVEHSNPFGLAAAVSFAPATNPNTARFVGFYKVQSLAQTIPIQSLLGRHAGSAAWSPDLRAYYTQAPTDPRYKDMASGIVAKLPAKYQQDPLAEAVAVKLALDHELTYSTKAKHDGMPDPTADMLWGNKTGYCVHFAHAAVFLWRSLGIPARIGVGYMSEEENRHGGSALVLRGSDAHAWPEIYIEHIGWIVLDIHAEKDLDPPPQSTDEDLTRLLGDLARNQPADPEDNGKPKSPPIPARDYVYAALALLLAVFFVLYDVKIWRRLAPRFSSDRDLPRVGYRLALDLVGELGFERAFGETREAFAERLRDVVPAFETLTALHLAARMHVFDPRTGAAVDREVWRGALEDLGRQLTNQYGVWRRLRGRLHPLSFRRST